MTTHPTFFANDELRAIYQPIFTRTPFTVTGLPAELEQLLKNPMT